MESKLYGGGPPGGSMPASIRDGVGTPAPMMAPQMPQMMPPGAPQAGPGMAGGPMPPPMPSPDDLAKGLHDTAYLNAKLRQLAEAKKLPTRKQVMELSSDLLQKGVLSPQRIATELATLPEAPDQILKWVNAHVITTGRQIDQISMMLHGSDRQPPVM